LQALHDRLSVSDPVSASKLHVNDRRRIIRALEVLHLTGHPISHWQMQFDDAHPAEKCRVFALRHPRPILHQRIAERVEQMYREGLVEEVERLLARHGHLSRTASQAVGYCEVIEHLQGKRSIEEAREQTLIRTRRFARHQETWFRGLSECHFIEVPADAAPELLANQVLELGGQRDPSLLFENR
jgi:tRNA dimethylallyltransferase